MLKTVLLSAKILMGLWYVWAVRNQYLSRYTLCLSVLKTAKEIFFSPMSTETSEWPYLFASGPVGFSFMTKEMHTGHIGFAPKLFTSLFPAGSRGS